MSGIITNIDELDKLKKSQYKTITKISFNNLPITDFVKLKNIAKLSNLIELDLSTNPELFNIVDDYELAQLYDTLKKSNILSDDFTKYKTAFISAAVKCKIDITKPIKKQINNIKMINQYKQLFFTNQSVKILNLSHNQLKTLPNNICNLINITNLDLSDNQLETLPLEIGNLINITNLNLSDNKLKTLPLEIGNLINITNLNLSDNQLLTLPFGIGNLINITNLDLSNNKLLTLPLEISNLINITNLNLSVNQLSTLPKEIINLINLTDLDLSYNQLKTLPLEIINLINLTDLDLSYNQLKTLPKEIINLINLTDLNLSHNQLLKLPNKISKLVNITNLDLSYNQLLKLPDKINKLVNITNLQCLNEIDFNDYFDFDNIDIYDYDNYNKLTKLNIEDFYDYYEKTIEEEYEQDCDYLRTTSGNENETHWSWDDYWEKYEDDKDEMVRVWEECYIPEYEDDINDAIKEYNKNFFNKFTYINEVSSTIFFLPNIKKISFCSRSEDLNSILENILDEDTKIELEDFFENLNVEIPYNITMTKSDDEWNIEIKQYITDKSIELTSINMVDYNSESD